ncbi:PREDICTED: uncharacterized protein LOC104807777 [Tarenaya hassleriana]|uniref:uncharacterized protein LOC104807777 n=1 Tax=Tarenaya hassleriana TaxID=28532 RepID=UPI00053C462D|nr:PREDICTED: uncharacterized protein LOC104807777 [Tarenaya hassleriana]
MSQEPPPVVNTSPPPQPQSEPPRRRWVAVARAFFDLPNPEIFKMFLISSLATFSSGIALAVEWTLHGQHHPGFRWIVYYASSLISLPILIWFGFTILIAFSARSETNAAHEHGPSGQSPDVSDETDNHPCRSLAVVVPSDERSKTVAL